MSAAQTPSALEALQCHYTWDLDASESKLLRVKDKLEDIGVNEGNHWLGHIYNLLGYIHHKMGLSQDAQSFFSRAAEAFSQTRQAASEDGPWLVVNYGNRAWLHHQLGEEAESRAYLTKLDALRSKYPPPSQDELHAETYAEKAWTLMKFSSDKSKVKGLFQKAVSIQPDVEDWQSSLSIAEIMHIKYSQKGTDAEISETLRNAKEKNPGNLYISVLYLLQRARKGENIEAEAVDLSGRILKNPDYSYSGFKALLMLYTKHICVDKSIGLAEAALKKHPDNRYVKRCAATCYSQKILYTRNRQHPTQSTMDRAISLHQDVISLYPHSSVSQKISLARIYLAKAEQEYQELLQRDMEPVYQQMVYNSYAQHLFSYRRDSEGSIRYHKMVAEIPEETDQRKKSIEVLQKIAAGENPASRDVHAFLERLQL